MKSFDEMNKDRVSEGIEPIELPENWAEECKLEDYARFNEMGVLVLKFLTNSFISEDSTYGPQNAFAVLNVEGDEIKFATSSKRCMNALACHFPIKDKTLKIMRTGQNMNTVYAVEDITLE